MICSIEGAGVWGAGYQHWDDLLEQHPVGSNGDCTAGGCSPASALPDSGPKPEIIPARERRRAPLAVKLAVEVAAQAFEQTAIKPKDTACVFASGMGDTSITDHMCRAVATADKLLSPTKFHNSVHNAAAGYWSISTECMMPANSISAYHYTAALALLEAATQSSVQQRPVLLVVYDIKTPETFAGSMSVSENFACALLLNPPHDSSNPAIKITCDATQPEQLDSANIHDTTTASTANPATQLIPLLRAIASRRVESQCLPAGSGSSLIVDYSPAGQTF